MPVIDYTSVRRLIETFLNDNYSSTVIQYENTYVDVVNVSEYISINDVTSDTYPTDMGGGTITVHGAIVIQIYTELGSGTQRGREIASELTDLFKSESLSGLNLTVPEFNSFGQVEGADYYQHNLTIPYVYAYGATELDAC